MPDQPAPGGGNPSSFSRRAGRRHRGRGRLARYKPGMDVSASSREDLPLALELLADLVRRPVFPVDAVDWAKERIVADLKADMEDPAYLADLVFRGLIYGAHPLGRDPRGTPREVRLLTRDDVIEHHRRHFAPESAFLVAVGDFEPRARPMGQGPFRIMAASGPGFATSATAPRDS